MRKSVAAGLALVLSGCAASPPVIVDASDIRGTVTPSQRPAMRPMSGPASIIGSGPASVLSRFGNPRIDLREGDARKLQFASDTCVVDVYFYPARRGEDATASHVAARRRADGAPLDPSTCLDAVASR